MMVSALTAACVLAKNDLAEWDQGGVDAWDGWTDAVQRILKEANKQLSVGKRLPHGLSKSEYAKSLPFVDLIAELQKLLPKIYRRHDGSWTSLVQALWRAMRMRKERTRREIVAKKTEEAAEARKSPAKSVDIRRR